MSTAALPASGQFPELTRKEAVQLIRGWIEDGVPAAAVRFLEGEGRLLTATSEGVSARIAIRKLRRQTGLTFSAAEMLKVKALISKALDEANLVAIRADPSFHPEHLEWIDRIGESFDELVRRGRGPAFVGHCLLNRDLYKALPALLADQDRVSVVSCRNLEPVLRDEYGIEQPVVYQIPSQYVMRDVDDEFEAALHDVPIWPDFYRELESRIEVRTEGEIFLIGAGLLGKGLCIQVREQGGIALDMGSTLDRMAGKTTRGSKRPPFRPPPETPRTVSGEKR